LSAKSSHAGPYYLDPELGQVRSDGIDDGRLVANEKVPLAMEAARHGLTSG